MRQPEKILLIGHTNIGDAIMSSPVIEALHRRFPQARLTLIVGHRAHPLFVKDPRVRQLIQIESFGEGISRLRMALWLSALNPDLVIDLRQTILPLLWRPWRSLAARGSALGGRHQRPPRRVVVEHPEIGFPAQDPKDLG